MTDMYKGQLDKGIARSIRSQEDTFVKGITENYKPFKKFTKDDLEFGYKIKFKVFLKLFINVDIEQNDFLGFRRKNGRTKSSSNSRRNGKRLVGWS